MAPTIAILAFLAGILSKDNRREAALCWFYAAVAIAFAAFFPSPAMFAHIGYVWWFLTCAGGEAAIIILAWVADAPASPYVALLSTVNMLLHLVVGAEYQFLHSAALYGIYHEAVPFIEIMQVVTLFLFSWPVVSTVRLIVHRINRRNLRWHQHLIHG